MKNWMSRLNVKKKLILYGYLIIIPVLLIICTALTLYNSNTIHNREIQENYASVNALKESIDLMQSEIKEISTYLSVNREVDTLLNSENPELLNKNSRLWYEEAPMQIVEDMIALNGYVKSIAIYPTSGLRPYLRCIDGSAFVPSTAEVQTTETYQTALESEFGMTWKSVTRGGNGTFTANRSEKVVLYRVLYDLSKSKVLGYVVIGANSEPFEAVCESAMDGEEESVIVLDQSGEKLVSVGSIDEKVLEFLQSEEFYEKRLQEKGNHFVYSNYEITYEVADNTESIICKIVPRYSLLQVFGEVAYMPFFLLIGVLIGFLPLLIVISNVITKPLSKFQVAINQFSQGDFEQQVEVLSDDEIGEVAACFNRMVGDIKTLIDENYVITLREKESELAALEAQINPHFLYNTLDSLYWQALDDNNEEIAESILALSQLFRLVLSQGQKEVSVAQEIELVSRYLQVQKLRFCERLEYEVIADAEAKNSRVPKLILQPFVENAIVHGFENVSTPCIVKVKVEKIENELLFRVEDTGIGMSQQQVEEIWRVDEEATDYAKQRIGKYAIKNIRERLQLRYRDNFELKIESSVGGGTVVMFRIPYEEVD